MYRIDRIGTGHCDLVPTRAELIAKLKTLKKETVSDVRKVYTSGVSDSVWEKYERFIGQGL